jgi:hypothetical protein
MTTKIRCFIYLIIFKLICFNTIIFSSELSVEDYPRSDLLLILDKLENNENIIFAKFGDGEYLCMSWSCPYKTGPLTNSFCFF